MNAGAFFKDRLPGIALFAVVLAANIVLLSAISAGMGAVVFTTGLWVLALCGWLGFDLLRRLRFYKKIDRLLGQLDKPYLLCEVIDSPDFAEGRSFYETIHCMAKAMNDEIARFKRDSDEYREYVETWMHEIKIPLASAKLAAENHPSAATARIDEDLDAIGALLQQTLFYARSSTAEKDYLIRDTRLQPVVGAALKRLAKSCIENHVSVRLEGMETTVYTDPKWAEFMIGQILANAVKYRGRSPEIKICAIQRKHAVQLKITDNGIGIPSQDVQRVFDKGFTGENGRRYAKSTGIGLYLCKKLCDKLSAGIALTSQQDRGTTVTLTFPAGQFVTPEREQMRT